MPNRAISTPRSRGALAGFLLILLGVWGVFVPLVGPLFDYAYTPDAAWTMTAGRWILQVLPGAAVVVGGLVLTSAATRVSGLVGGLLAAAGGAWYVLGPVVAPLWDPTGSLQGQPLGTGVRAVVEEIGLFTGLGVAIVFLAALAIGRFTIRGHRDTEAVQAARERRMRRRHAHTATAAVPGPGPAAAVVAGDPTPGSTTAVRTPAASDPGGAPAMDRNRPAGETATGESDRGRSSTPRTAADAARDGRR